MLLAVQRGERGAGHAARGRCSSTTWRGCARASFATGRSPAPAELTHRDGRRRRARAHALHDLGPAPRRPTSSELSEAHPVAPAGALLHARRLLGRRRAGRSRAGAAARRVRRGPPRRARGGAGAGADRGAGGGVRARVRDRGALLRRGRRAPGPRRSAASCTRSSAPACATRSSAGARSSPTSRASARPSRRWPRSRRDDAFPAVVVCPASMKLIWERETPALAARTAAWPCSTGAPTPPGPRRRARPTSWCSTTTSSTAHSDTLAGAGRARSSWTSRTT